MLIRAIGDGTFFIDVIKEDSVYFARASARDLGVAANRTISECVCDGHGIGEVATGVRELLLPTRTRARDFNVLYVGIDAKIGVVVQAYQPKADCLVLVHGDSSACYAILQKMNASMLTVTFNPEDFGVVTSVPMKYRAGSQSMSPLSLTSKA